MMNEPKDTSSQCKYIWSLKASEVCQRTLLNEQHQTNEFTIYVRHKVVEECKTGLGYKNISQALKRALIRDATKKSTVTLVKMHTSGGRKGSTEWVSKVSILRKK